MKSKEAEDRGGEAIDTSLEKGISRREAIKLGAGLFATLFLGNTKKAAAYLEKKANEQKEGPKVEIGIFYSAHVSGADIKGLAPKIREADIFIPEMLGGDKQIIDQLSDFSAGRTNPNQFFKERNIKLEEIEEGFEPFGVALARALYKTHKLIFTVDVPAGHPLHGRMEEVRLSKIDLSLPFSQVLAAQRKRIHEYANLNVEREQFMLQGITKLKQDLSRGLVPELRGKELVKILLFLGATHSRIYQELKKGGEDVRQEFSQMPFIIGSAEEEAIGRFMFGKEVSDELIAKSLFSGLLQGLLWIQLSEISANTHNKLIFLRKAADRFSFEEIKKTFGAMEQFQRSPGPGMFELTLLGQLESRGVVLPSSEKGLEEAIKERR